MEEFAEMEGKKLYTIEQAAKVLHYNPRTVRQMCLDGKIPGAYKLPGGGRKWLIPEEALHTSYKGEDKKAEHGKDTEVRAKDTFVAIREEHLSAIRNMLLDWLDELGHPNLDAPGLARFSYSVEREAVSSHASALPLGR